MKKKEYLEHGIYTKTVAEGLYESIDEENR